MKRTACKVKICGTTSATDAQMAVDAGADYCGVVLEVPFSERSVCIDTAVKIVQQTSIPTVILVFDRATHWVRHVAEIIQPFAIQLLGHEVPAEVEQLKRHVSCEVWKSLFLPTGQSEKQNLERIRVEMQAYIHAGADAFLFDTAEVSQGKVRFGGTGKTSDWDIAAKLIAASMIPAFLSGGIRTENVGRAIETVHPYGIDLCSGVESVKGSRDARKLKLLMDAVRQSRD
jgi:phosphoribosylanthranilate isomerase